MHATDLVSVEEYLSTDYQPDCEFVDGVIEERNVGEHDHADLQGSIHAYLWNQRRRLKAWPLVEQRIRVSARRYRVPDICVTVGDKPLENVFTQPPFLIIEILSPEDRMNRVLARLREFVDFGVKYAWLIDPE